MTGSKANKLKDRFHNLCNSPNLHFTTGSGVYRKTLIEASDSRDYHNTEREFIEMLPEMIRFFEKLDNVLTKVSANVVNSMQSLDFSIQGQRITVEQYREFLGSPEFMKLRILLPDVAK
ncbi:hypothetical protein DFS34DRAFT_596212 [Phlyctochytrium arcticum]|nr:hypothetical protein DFS34DRAFT_596212 [Phlyctochytrium arcticum]